MAESAGEKRRARDKTEPQPPKRTPEEEEALLLAERRRLDVVARHFELAPHEGSGADGSGTCMRLVAYALDCHRGVWAQLAVPRVGGMVQRLAQHWHQLGYAVLVGSSYTEEFAQVTLWRSPAT